MKTQKNDMKHCHKSIPNNRWRYNPNQKAMLANQKPEKRVISGCDSIEKAAVLKILMFMSTGPKLQKKKKKKPSCKFSRQLKHYPNQPLKNLHGNNNPYFK